MRAGGGVFYDRLQGNPVFDMLPNPPSTIIPKFYYGNLASIPPASAGTFFPAGVVGFDKGGHIPTTYNWNLTIQRELPGSILLDVGYVGSSSNHNLYRVNQNAIPLGAAWLPQNQDPLNTSPKFDGTTSNQPNFYRPYLGLHEYDRLRLRRELELSLAAGVGAPAVRAGTSPSTWPTPGPR